MLLLLLLLLLLPSLHLAGNYSLRGFLVTINFSPPPPAAPPSVDSSHPPYLMSSPCLIIPVTIK